MAGFDYKSLQDAIYDALDDTSLTSLLADGSDGIYHKKVPRGVDVLYPLVLFYTWDEPIYRYSLSQTRTHVEGSFRITGWTEDDSEAAEEIASAIDNLLTNVDFSVTGMGLYVCRCKRTISRVLEHDDTQYYHESGGIYEIGVSV